MVSRYTAVDDTNRSRVSADRQLVCLNHGDAVRNFLVLEPSPTTNSTLTSRVLFQSYHPFQETKILPHRVLFHRFDECVMSQYLCALVICFNRKKVARIKLLMNGRDLLYIFDSIYPLNDPEVFLRNASPMK